MRKSVFVDDAVTMGNFSLIVIDYESLLIICCN